METKYGSFLIYPLSEGTFTVDSTKVFIPFNSSNDNLQDRNTGSLLVEVQPFLVRYRNEIILLDSGIGLYTDNIMPLINNLSNIGIQPNQVTKVLMTHLHKDHAGGISKKDCNGNFEIAFPNATYYVQQKELESAWKIGFPYYFPKELEPLKNNPNLCLLDGDGFIDGWIEYKITSAHSPFHQVFWLRSNNGETLFFGGDDAPQLQQMKTKFIAKYDYDGKKCMELRKEWWEEGKEKGWTFLYYHDVKTPYAVAGS